MMDFVLYYGKKSGNENPQRRLDIGDDAVPYLGEHLLSVADAMGGSAFRPVRSINPAALGRETAFDTVTKNCLSPAGEACREQFNQNFEYLFSMGEEYLNHPRKSSYFGARLTNIFLRDYLEQKLPGEELAAYMHQLHDLDEQERTDALSTLEREVEEALRTRLIQAVHNSGMDALLAEEAAFSLGTTYTGMLCVEDADCVHAIAIQAGDSLAMALVPEKDDEDRDMLCFRMLLPAQEEAAGGATTNRISVNNSFYLRCGYFCLPKPCALMVMSDGCFDLCSSMVRFERFMMDRLSAPEAQEMADMSKVLYDVYAMDVCNDDSSSMAMRAFGYDEFKTLKAQAYFRQEWLDRHYGEVLGDVRAEREAEDELEAAKVQRIRNRNRMLAEHADAFWKGSAWIREVSCKDAELPRRNLIEKEKAKLDAEKDRLRGQLQGVTAKANALVRANWLTIRTQLPGTREKHEEHRISVFGTRPDDPGKRVQEAMKIAADAERDMLAAFRWAAEVSGVYSRSCSQIAGKSKAEGEPDEVFKSLTKAHQQAEAKRRQMKDADAKAKQLLSDLLYQEKERIDSFTDMLYQDGASELAKLPPEARQTIADSREDYLRCSEQIKAIPDMLTAAVERIAYDYYCEAPLSAILKCIAEHPETLPEDLLTKYEQICMEADREWDVLNQAERVRQERFTDYEQQLQQIMLDRR